MRLCLFTIFEDGSKFLNIMDQVKVGDIVWAKMVGFPSWPCVIRKDTDLIQKPSNDPNKKFFWVFFFGTYNYAWIAKEKLSLFEENRLKYTRNSRTYHFVEAVEEAELHLRRKRINPNYRVNVKEKLRLKSNKKKMKVTQNRRIKKKNLNKIVNNRRRTFNNNKYDTRIILDTSKILTSTVVFGVLGAGTIASGVIKNLVMSGHMINIWNRTRSKCCSLVDELGAPFRKKVAIVFSPRSLLESSQVIFICVSDQEVVNDIFEEYFGINDPEDKLMQNKGIVQITTTGPENSKDMEAVVERKGGRYLEAQVQGGKLEALEGNLLVLASGDKSLFFQCQSCFKAIGTTAMYLGEVGYASRINLLLQLMKGVQLAALSEALSLADACGIPHKEFMDIFSTSNLSSRYLNGKFNTIVKKDFNNVDQALTYLQRDLKLGLEVCNTEKQPMYLASVANEMFKHCKRLGYGNYDASVIYMRNQ